MLDSKVAKPTPAVPVGLIIKLVTAIVGMISAVIQKSKKKPAIK